MICRLVKHTPLVDTVIELVYLSISPLRKLWARGRGASLSNLVIGLQRSRQLAKGILLESRPICISHGYQWDRKVSDFFDRGPVCLVSTRETQDKLDGLLSLSLSDGSDRRGPGRGISKVGAAFFLRVC